MERQCGLGDGVAPRGRVKLAGRVSCAVLVAVLRQFAARVGHVPVRMIVLVRRRRRQTRLTILREILEIHGEVLQHHAIHRHRRLGERRELAYRVVPPFGRKNDTQDLSLLQRLRRVHIA